MHTTTKVKLFANFRSGRFDLAEREYPPGTVIADIVDELQIPRAEIGILLVNGRHVGLGYKTLPGDDTISIFPLLGGG
jgi:molybdopterin converting factor small subunit